MICFNKRQSYKNLYKGHVMLKNRTRILHAAESAKLMQNSFILTTLETTFSKKIAK